MNCGTFLAEIFSKGLTRPSLVCKTLAVIGIGIQIQNQIFEFLTTVK